MEIVPHLTGQTYRDVEAILLGDGRENLIVLDPVGGVGFNIDKTTNEWFKLVHFIFVGAKEILEHNWHHEWLTYRLIPVHFKTQWFFLLARKYTWDPKHTSTVWTQFNLVARTLYREQMRYLRKRWARGDDKPGWMNRMVWNNLVDMFEELGGDDVGPRN